MRAVVQRVTRARVTVEGHSVGEIGPGLCVLVGITHDDDEADVARVADKIWNLRVFDDDDGVMNRSAADVDGELLVVSQFTLYGDTRKGRRPSYVEAARPEVAEPMIELLCERLRDAGATVATGRFRADMTVEISNDGPCTILIDT